MGNFENLQEQYKNGSLTVDTHRIKTSITAPSPESILTLPETNSSEYHNLEALGREALESKQVGAIVLAGGMATRFNYDKPKGLFPILDDYTFIDLKIKDLKSWNLPVYIMTSEATHESTLNYLQEKNFYNYESHIFLFKQFSFPRLNKNGSIRSDRASSGHGDFVEALKVEHHLQRFLENKGKYLFFSNIDNLGATVDVALLGMHIKNQKEMSIEVAAKAPGDKGGAPAEVGGRLQLVEGFLFPEDFDQDSIPVFNTASYIFNAEALMKEFQLPWYVVHKTVDNQEIVQFEHLAGDLSIELAIQCIQTERDERFLPVKKQSDVSLVQPLIKKKFNLK